MYTNDAGPNPKQIAGEIAGEIAGLIELAGTEHQRMTEMQASWERLRASHRAKQRLQHLTPSEIDAALARSRQMLGEEGK